MGSPISSIVANLYMEHFESRAFTPPPPLQLCGIDMLMTQ